VLKESNKIFKRGEIWLINLGTIETRRGSIQYGVRPCLVISNNRNNLHSGNLTIIPISSASTKIRKMLPTHTLITPETTEIKMDSIIMAEQITVISKDQVMEKLFELDEDILQQVNYTILIQVGLLQSMPA